ncbi:acetyltransferase domain-containing protein [Xylariaceae sp. FL1019]|nr:acetyltransferase domain-containing protein [Xylariaceae sp. FL1019]
MATPSDPAPPHAPPPVSSKIKVKTTWPTTPLPLNIAREPIRTQRLLIRPYEDTDSDAAAIHALRSQPEVMLFTMQGVIDKDLEASRVFIQRSLPPNDAQRYNWVITYLGENGELQGDEKIFVGCGGVHKTDYQLGWPEVGYMVRKEYWGIGLATEFMRAFVDAWWKLPRKEVEVEIAADTVVGEMERDESGAVRVVEKLTATIDANNPGSRRVLEKTGFKQSKQWTEADSRKGFEGADVTLVAFLLDRPGGE